MILSCADALARAMKRYLQMMKERGEPAPQKKEEPQPAPASAVTSGETQMLLCPDCGGTIEHLEGCMLCRACGFSRCA